MTIWEALQGALLATLLFMTVMLCVGTALFAAGQFIERCADRWGDAGAFFGLMAVIISIAFSIFWAIFYYQ